MVVLLAVAAEVHPFEFVTVNVYVPADKPVNVVVDPVPDFVDPPVAVTVQVPVCGNPLNATEPVLTVVVGCVTVPTTGADGDTGWALITAEDDADEVNPSLFVTVNV
jgi:hypothetical protein